MTFLRALLGLAACLGAMLPGPVRALDQSQLAVIVNVRDPLSVQIGEYYAQQRRIIFQNFIKVSFAPNRAMLTREDFEQIEEQVERQTQPVVQAYALTWAAPYRVECMSITAAFAFGFDEALCANGCKPTRRNPYFNSNSRLPFTQFRMRPTMSIAAQTIEDAKALIDRGVKSDGSQPKGTAYLVSTTDKSRDVRNAGYHQVDKLQTRGVRVRRIVRDELRDVADVLFYFIGKERIRGLETLGFLPGAIADHVTSFGGEMPKSGQMSALRWLEAGATGSYGTVVEPCALPGKFPIPALVIGRYLAGETLIEAYWKSVLMPGQGIFIGEPLAAPFRQRER